MRLTILIAVATVIAACGGKEEREQESMQGMGNMPAMGGMTMRSDSLMPGMRAHLDSLAGMSPELAGRMLATHDALAAQMLDAMGSDMRMMNMRADSTWVMLTDSIRRDLADLPAMSGNGLETRLRAHAERMRRLLAMHEQMMQQRR